MTEGGTPHIIPPRPETWRRPKVEGLAAQRRFARAREAIFHNASYATFGTKQSQALTEMPQRTRSDLAV